MEEDAREKEEEEQRERREWRERERQARGLMRDDKERSV